MPRFSRSSPMRRPAHAARPARVWRALMWGVLSSLFLATSAHASKPKTHPDDVKCDRSADQKRVVGTPDDFFAWCERAGIKHGPSLRASSPAKGAQYEFGRFVNGKRQGRWVIRGRFDDLTGEGRFIAGERQGTWTFRDQNRHLMQQGPFSAGMRQGRWQGFLNLNTPSYRGHYCAGVRCGDWILYFDNGQKAAVVAFARGKPDELLELYRRDGRHVERVRASAKLGTRMPESAHYRRVRINQCADGANPGCLSWLKEQPLHIARRGVERVCPGPDGKPVRHKAKVLVRTPQFMTVLFKGDPIETVLWQVDDVVYLAGPDRCEPTGRVGDRGIILETFDKAPRKPRRKIGHRKR